MSTTKERELKPATFGFALITEEDAETTTKMHIHRLDDRRTMLCGKTTEVVQYGELEEFLGKYEVCRACRDEYFKLVFKP